MLPHPTISIFIHLKNEECFVVVVLPMKCPPVNVLLLKHFLAQDGATSLCVACQKGHLPIVEQLLVAKADVNHQSKVDPFIPCTCTLYCITRNTIYDTVASVFLFLCD